MFDHLAQAADALHDKIDAQIASMSSALPEPPPRICQSPILNQLRPLKASTTPEAVQAAGTFSEDDAAELERLNRALRQESPAQQAATVRAREALLQSLVNRITSVSTTLTSEAILAINQHLSALAEAMKADQLATNEAFAHFLPGTGSDPWKALWEHARAFSEQAAYPGVSFPNIDDDARCVLCQQPLSEEARNRLTTLEDYVKAETAARVRECAEAIADDRRRIGALPLHDDALEAVSQELSAHDPKLAAAVQRFFEQATEIRHQLIEALDTTTETPLSEHVYDTASIAQIISALETEALALIEQQDDEGLQAAQARLVELEARKWVHENERAINAEVERLQVVFRLAKARKTTDTTAISKKGSDLTATYVTADLERRIEQEMARVGPRALSIGLVRKGEKGATSHQLEIKHTKVKGVPVDEILSEGELCAIALATFLAELAQSPSSSGVIVDDPVSSLDHLHRAEVADRLAEEADRRQVVVFTHDLVFLNDLLHAAARRELTPTVRQLARVQRSTGVVSEDLPWHGKPASKRIATLQGELDRLRELYQDDEAAYEEPAKTWYGHLRETWERAVEELLLNSVVLRFSHDVRTSRLKPVTDLTLEDYRKVDAAVSKASKWLRGHDQAPAVNAPVRPPDELQSDLDELSSYISHLTGNKRKRSPDPRI